MGSGSEICGKLLEKIIAVKYGKWQNKKNILRNIVKWQGNMGSGRKREIFCDSSGREIWKMVGKNKYSEKYGEVAGKYGKWLEKINILRNNGKWKGNMASGWKR